MSAIEDEVCRKLQERAAHGLQKYGVTVERTDLTEVDWLRHAQEEALDLAVYLQRLLTQTEDRNMNDPNQVTLGDRVVDTVTGFSGTAIARHEYLAGCERFTVQPPVKEDGKLPECETFDAPQLRVDITRAPAPRGPADIGGPEKYMPKARPA